MTSPRETPQQEAERLVAACANLKFHRLAGVDAARLLAAAIAAHREAEAEVREQANAYFRKKAECEAAEAKLAWAETVAQALESDCDSYVAKIEAKNAELTRLRRIEQAADGMRDEFKQHPERDIGMWDGGRCGGCLKPLNEAIPHTEGCVIADYDASKEAGA